MTLAEALVYQREQDEAKRPFYGNPNFAAQGRNVERQRAFPFMPAADLPNETPATMNPNLAAQGEAYRANMTPPTSVMDPRYPAWKQNQNAADAVGAVGDLALSAIPMARPALQGVKAAGRFAAPVAGQALENYMGRMGMQLNVVNTQGPKTTNEEILKDFWAALDNASDGYIGVRSDDAVIKNAFRKSWNRPEGEKTTRLPGTSVIGVGYENITEQQLLNAIEKSRRYGKNTYLLEGKYSPEVQYLANDPEEKLMSSNKILSSYMQLNAVPESTTLKAGKGELMPTEYKSAMSIEPPHNVRDTKKLLSLTESMKNAGWQGRPILTYDVGRGEEALTGSHRIKAAREANIEVPIYRIENAGNYVDKNGKSILDVGFMDINDQIKWLNKFGDKNAAKLLKQEPDF